ncbi:hypothetical protein CERSUDRAFT_132615 [Gelatoporia subvermispora B]|uniref:SP-RING-type domain-containing protein n=1 Tax=Ceriporiopsis subvermispora (strain B) TaxID=914234 RepID=M2RND8_CERS8|nr:hypothetical protein CERSUDRAFT_132615 [Gelatoporia subvermispora B]
MPTTSTSRRRASARHRSPTHEDTIEEADATQYPRDVDGVEDDDEQAARPQRPSKKAKKEPAQTAALASEEEDNEEVDNDIFDLEDQPLDRNQAQKIGGVASDWAHLRKQIHVTAYNLVRDVAAATAEFADEEKAEDAVTKIDLMMRDLIDTEHELLSHERALEEIKQKVASKEPVSDVVNRYEKGVRNKLDEYKGKTTRQKYGKNDEYHKFRQAIFEVQHPDTAMPPAIEFLPREEGDDSDDDEDVLVGGVTQDFKCPLTLTLLQDPVTSSVCGHSFSAVAIKEYLKYNRTAKKQCPASGCKQYISLGDLEPDKDLAKKVKDAARRQRMRDSDDDAEEIIE